MSSENIDVNDYANSTLSFPQKLFILLEVDKTGLITWASHGMCFRIEDPDKFAEDIVPRYFKQTKLTSFQRQLNLYGFRRLSKGEDQGCYFHPKFQRNRKDLLSEIKRLPVKGSLQTYDQVMAAVHSLPSERFGSKRKHPSVSTEVCSQSEESTAKRQAIEQPNPPAVSTTASTQVLAPSAIEINSAYPKMSKLSMNIGFAKFLENQKQNSLNKQVPPPRPEHLLRSQGQRQQQQQQFPSILEHQRDLINFPVYSNFSFERDENPKTFMKRSSETSLPLDDLDLLDFLEPIRNDIDVPDAHVNEDEYIPSFDEAILQNRIL